MRLALRRRPHRAAYARAVHYVRGAVAASEDGDRKQPKSQAWDADWQVTENSRRAKIYRLTQTGKKQLHNEAADCNAGSPAISRLRKTEA
jgi:hypothetical protein